MISKQKLALIHVGKKELGWSEEVYRHVLRDHGGVENAKDLDEEGAKKVIEHMKAMGFWIQRKFEQERPRAAGDMVTAPPSFLEPASAPKPRSKLSVKSAAGSLTSPAQCLGRLHCADHLAHSTIQSTKYLDVESERPVRSSRWLSNRNHCRYPFPQPTFQL